MVCQIPSARLVERKIAREYHVTRQNVSNAINEIADLVGLEPRPTSKGED